MDRLLALQAFARVIELGGFTKAGDSLQLSKTTVSDLVQRAVELCRELRNRGMTVTTAHAMDAVRALRSGSIDSRQRTYLALRCVLVGRPEEEEVFEEERECAE